MNTPDRAAGLRPMLFRAVGLWAGLTLAGSAMMGCDQSATQTQQARMDLDEAFTAIGKASFTLPTDDASSGQARVAQLQSVLEKLDAVIASGDPTQAGIARRQKAAILAADAQAQLREAQLAQAQAQGDLAALMLKVDQIDSLANHALEADRDPQAAIQTLNRTIESVNQRKAQLTENIATLDAKIADVQKQIEGKREVAQKAVTKQMASRSDAFMLEGDAYYDKLASALQHEREANQADVEARKLQSQLDQLNNERAIFARELELANLATTQLSQRTGSLKTQGQQAIQQVAEARASQIEQADQAAKALSSTTSTFRSGVIEPLNRSVEQARAAVELLEASSAGGGTANQIDLLINRLQLAQAYAATESYTLQLANGLEGLSQRASLGEKTRPFAQASSEMREVANAAAESLKQTLEAATQDAQALGNAGEGPAGRAAAAAAASLQRLQAQLNNRG
jgi:chromosome segregation ATPase